MGAVTYSALAFCLTLCAVASFSARASGGNGKMCGAIVTEDDGNDWVALRNNAFSALRRACRRRVQTTSILDTVTIKDCSFVTEATSKDDRSFIFILKPLVPPFRLSFDVKAPSKAMILLASERTSVSVFAEIAIGYGNNQGAFIRTCYSGDTNCNTGLKFTEISESGLVSTVEFRTFWVDFNEGAITVGKSNEIASFMDWNAGVYHNRDYPEVHVGIATFGDNERGDWVFHGFCE